MAQNKNLAEFMRAPEWARVNDENRKVVEHHVLRGPPVKLSALARDLGLTVKSTAFANQSISGEIRLEENRSFIVRVNKFENKVRQRFTVAHEISHFLLHRHIIEEENGIRDDVLYRSDLSNKIEAEANRLAADILMPANMIRIAAEDLGTEDLLELAEILAFRFEVSNTAMRIRLGLGA